MNKLQKQSFNIVAWEKIYKYIFRGEKKYSTMYYAYYYFPI